MLGRRLLTPLGGLFVFLLIVALVAGGLGWVTAAALKVEAAEQDATARADASAKERVALWQLDSRLIPTLAVENGRPYAQYFTLYIPHPVARDALGNLSSAGRVPSPLVSAALPDWMLLHFQLDPDKGWDSPQVLPAKLATELEQQFGDEVALDGVSRRRSLLKELQDKFAVRATHALWITQEQADPSDGIFSVPVYDPPPAAEPLVKSQAPGPLPPGDANPPGLRNASRSAGAVPPAEYDRAANQFQSDRDKRRTTSERAITDASQAASGQYPMTNSARGGFGGAAPSPTPSAADKGQPAAGGPPPPAPAGPGGPSPKPEAKKDAAKTEDKTEPKPVAKATPPAGGEKAVGRRVLGADADRKFAERAPAVQVGPIRPQWLTAADGSTYLILVRAARLETKTVFQGVLLDWPRLKEVLLDEVRPAFPEAKLVPAADGDDAAGNERRMASIPARLDPGPTPPPPAAGWTPLRWGLSLGWGTALVALAATWFGGRALIDLSERRIRFVSAVTHELRTPLTSLRLYLDLLTSGLVEDGEKQREYLRTLSGESDRLNRLIENVLDFARLEKRTVQTHVAPTTVDSLLEAARATWAERCAADGKELVVIGTVPVDQTVTTDARVAGQILSNLIDNARKYSPAAADPRIWVWAKPGDGQRVIFEVEDRGPGVPPAERAAIFRPFRRGQSADTTAGGAGLGLALAKQWAEMLGGRLTYRPADGGVGACFRLELPV